MSALGALALLLAACVLPPLTAPESPPVEQTRTEPPELAGNTVAASVVAERNGVVEALEATPEIVRATQRMLTGLGYEPGPIDGVAGDKTGAAIREYQTNAGLEPSGRIDERLVFSLVAASEAHTTSGITAHEAAALDGDVLPAYRVGDAFLYSDSRMERVAELDGNIVRWETNHGTEMTSHRNFLLPPVLLETASRSEATSVDVPQDALWPLEVGREVQFSSATDVRHASRPYDRSSMVRDWHCRVAAIERISVAAGTFETFRIGCRAVVPTPGLPLERVWYYAPAIGHYVRREEIFGPDEPSRRVDLVAIQLGNATWPPAARAGFDRAFDYALETQPKGEGVEWRSSGVDAQVTITPTMERRLDDADYCRTFVQTVERSGDSRVYPGLACRQPSGGWAIPVLRGGAS